MWVLFVPSPRSYTTSNVEPCARVLSTLLKSVPAKYVPASRFSTPGSLNMANLSSSYNEFAILPLGGVVSTTVTVLIMWVLFFPSPRSYTTSNVEPCTRVLSTLLVSVEAKYVPASRFSTLGSLNMANLSSSYNGFAILPLGGVVSTIVTVLIMWVLFVPSPRSYTTSNVESGARVLSTLLVSIRAK